MKFILYCVLILKYFEFEFFMNFAISSFMFFLNAFYSIRFEQDYNTFKIIF